MVEKIIGKMRAKFISEITKIENDWANSQINQWEESRKYSEENYEDYIDNIINAIWYRLIRKLSPEFLMRTKINKKTLREYITEYNNPYGLYMCIADYWKENTPIDEAANTMFDEVYRAITSQGGAR